MATAMGGRLEGRVTVVTGAGSSGPGLGNGKAAAVQYAREGAIVVAIDINPDAVAETLVLRAETRADAGDEKGGRADAKRALELAAGLELRSRARRVLGKE